MNRKPNNVQKGQAGEVLATNYLLEHGYLIREKNYRFKRAEIDIIASRNDTLVFVEVKARSSNYFSNPEDAVSKKKIDLLLMAAEEYILNNKWEMDIRFDIISIEFKKGSPEIIHIEDAFY